MTHSDPALPLVVGVESGGFKGGSGGSFVGPPREDSVERASCLAAVRRRLTALPVESATFSRYIVRRRVAAGGIGVVYAAWDPKLQRSVAIKLLRRDGDKEALGRASRRLVQEARVLAGLSHPNIVPVYDVGVDDGGRMFVVMELVEGEDMSQWLTRTRPSWREIVATFVAAGRGLLAAHEAGVIHRDFKPANVLLGARGEVRVADFGLACIAADQPVFTTRPRERTPSSSSLELRTRTGTVMGTPSYMAPEQHAGATADERSDQYAFCVALYRALYGASPFDEQTLDGLSDAKLSGSVRPQLITRAPRYLWRLIRRGLEPDPRRRHESMAALLEKLEMGAARRRRWRWAASVIVLGAVGLAAAGPAPPGPLPGCESSAASKDAVWSPDRRDRVLRALGSHVSPESATRVADQLDAHLDRWRSAHAEHCSDVGGGQTPRARATCLDRNLQRVDALVTVFEDADAGVADAALLAVERIPDVASCTDAVARPVLVPADAASRAAVERERTRIARANALLDAGRYEQGRLEAEAIVAAADDLAFPPLRCEALHLLGSALDLGGAYDEARASFEDALLIAEATRHDEIAVRAASAITNVLGDRQDDFDAALRWERRARAAVDRWGRGTRLEADYLNILGNVHQMRGAAELAMVAHEAALSLRLEKFPHEELALATVLNNLGGDLVALGRFAEAISRLQQSFEIRSRLLDPRHPFVAFSNHNLANPLLGLGRAREAEEHYRRALDIWLGAHGLDHPNVGLGRHSLGSLLAQQGRRREAEEHLLEALRIREQSNGPRHPWTCTTLSMLGVAAGDDLAVAEPWLRRALECLGGADAPDPRVADILVNLGGSVAKEDGRAEEGRRLLEKAVGRLELKGEPHAHSAGARTALGTALFNLALAKERAGDPQSALADRRRALSLFGPVLGPDDSRLSMLLVVTGEAELAYGERGRAAELLARGLDVLERQDAPAGDIAYARKALASAREPTRARPR